MRIFKILLSAGLMACATVASAELRQIGPSSVNVIDGPGTVYRLVTRLSQGTKVNVVERYQGYALIKLNTGVNAWVKNSALVAPGTRVSVAKAVKPAPAPIKVEDVEPYTTVVWTKADPLNMRKGPGFTHTVFSQCQRGDWVKVVGKAGIWAKIELSGGKQGWVHSAYLTR